MRMSELFEAYIPPRDITNQRALYDNDTVRVYHGTSDLDFVFVALTRGVSGTMRANRIYSYEYNNNPKGLFVTPDLRTAKEFGPYILEFHTRVSDLEAPVWPGGMYTVQGGMSGTFRDEDDREMERLRQREKFSASDMEFIRNSDRPELAATLLSYGERQALFKGQLNPNSIRAIWMSSDPKRTNSQYGRMSPREFLTKAKREGIPTRWGTKVHGADENNEKVWKHDDKVVRPRDVITGEQFVHLLLKKYKHLDREELVDILKNNQDYIDRFLWSDEQIKRVTADVKRM